MSETDDFIQESTERLIPKGSTIPHPAGWKGRASNQLEEMVPGMPLMKVPARVRVETHTGRQVRRKVTQKQVDALRYRLQGHSKRQAMIKAGYSVKMAAQPSRIFGSPVIKSLLDSMQEEFDKLGINKAYLAGKFKEWMEAKQTVFTKTGKIVTEVPDYDTQLKAFDRFKEVVDQENNPKSKLARKITLEEFISGDRPEPPQTDL